MQTFASIRFKQLIACSAMLCLFCAGKASAQIVLDGSMGHSGELRGPNYVITAGMGSQYGSNLFHSFGVFNVNTDESATFTGPALVDNVIGRVTGGLASDIDGRLSCSIDGANLYLINPSGIIFGPHASLDVTGSFVATTADYVKLSDGGRFDAANPSSSVLSSAPVSAFGFLDGNIGAITVDRAYLQVDDGKSISMVGGDIEIWNGYLVAPGGRIDLASVASEGEALLSGSTAPDVSSFSKLGNINITHHAWRFDEEDYPLFPGDSGANLDTSGDSGGAIYIRGDQLVVDGGWIYADAYGSGDSVGIDIDVAGKIEISNDSQITSASLGVGDAGDIRINAGGGVSLSGGSYIIAESQGEMPGAGNGGDISIKAQSVALNEFASLSVGTLGVGAGGDINITADKLTLSGGGEITVKSQGEIGGAGNSGNIFINAGTVELKDESLLTADTTGLGAGGGININANRLTLSGGSWIRATSEGEMAGAGNGGNILVNVDNVRMEGSSTISATTWGSGAGGDIIINSRDMTLSGGSWIYADSKSSATGDGGGVTVAAVTLAMTGGAKISASTLGSGNGGDVSVKANSILLDSATLDGESATGIYANSQSTSAGSGDGGAITVDTGTLTMRGGSQIGAGTRGSGGGGHIFINAGSVDMEGESALSTSTFGPGAGGDVRVTVAGGVSLSGGSSVASMSLGGMAGAGDGGNILVNAANVDLKDLSYLSVSTYGYGAGGDIQVAAGGIALSGGSWIHCNSLGEMAGAGNGGKLVINAANVDLKDWSDMSASTFGHGAGGDININVRNLALSSGSFVFSSSGGAMAGAGGGGNIVINAGSIDMKNHGQISVGASGPGAGGDISITAGNMALSAGSVVSADSYGNMVDAGRAGNIDLYVAESLLLSASGLTTGSVRSSGGSIALNSGYVILTDGGSISSSVYSGEGGGGNVAINSVNLLALDASDITANAYDGRGGKVFLNTEAYIHSPDSVITANSNRQELQGTVTIQSPAQDISGSLAALSSQYTTGNVMVADRCMARSFENSSSFTLGGRDAITLDPESAVLLRMGNGDGCFGTEEPAVGRKR